MLCGIQENFPNDTQHQELLRLTERSTMLSAQHGAGECVIFNMTRSPAHYTTQLLIILSFFSHQSQIFSAGKLGYSPWALPRSQFAIFGAQFLGGRESPQAGQLLCTNSSQLLKTGFHDPFKSFILKLAQFLQCLFSLPQVLHTGAPPLPVYNLH